MSRTRLTLLAGASGMVLALAGCEDMGLAQKPAGEASSGVERPAASRLVERDVEAPEVFKKTENGLWDGRPSLGGVWVAHPDVRDPERVIIRNEANGQYVIGALFRRERENPGPALQVSSDAAASLGLVAGQPTRLNVVALRREEEKAPALAVDTRAIADPAKAPAEARTIAEPEAIAATTLDGAATETAATAATAEATPKAPRQPWNPFRRKAAAESAPPETAPPETAPSETAATAGAAPVATPPAGSGAIAAGTLANVETVSARPLSSSPAEPAATGAAAPQKERWNPFRRKPADPANALRPEALQEIAAAPAPRATTPAAAPAPATPRRTAPAATGKPFVQIGIFSVEDNANRAAQIMRKNGVLPTVTKSSSQGKGYWRVVVGPASGAADQTALLRKVRDLGFADAFAVGR